VLKKDTNSTKGIASRGSWHCAEDAAGAVKSSTGRPRQPNQTDLSLAYFQALINNQQGPEPRKWAAVIDKNKTSRPCTTSCTSLHAAKQAPDAERFCSGR
jgi:hypothetical protein